MKTKIPLDEADRIAGEMVREFAPYCERIEVAGSIRRRKPEVGDIEIVCIPRFEAITNLFSESIRGRSALEYPLGRLKQTGCRFVKDGPRMKQIIYPDGYCLDLFIVLPPAQWGVIFAIRTGPQEFSEWLVTQRNKGGGLPSYLRVEHGCVWHGSEVLPMPEEDDFLDICELAGCPPSLRRPGVRRADWLVSQ